MLTTKTLASFDGFKSITDAGTFEGVLSPYGNVDRGGDVVERGAFQKNIAEKGVVRPLLWQHMTTMPIGDLTLADRADGLYAKGRLLMSLPEAKRAYDLIKAGITTGLSIGFKTMREEFRGSVRHLKEIALYEGSIVTFPMNELAQITSVKALDPERVRKSLEDFRRGILGAFERNL